MVRAVNAKGEGQFSSASAPEHPLRPPDAPAAPVGERGDKTINVRWSPPGNGGDPIIEYEVQILSTGAVNTTTGTSLQWANLPNGQPQQFRVPGPQPRPAGDRSRRPRRAVVPCGVPDRTRQRHGAAGRRRGDRLVGRARATRAAPSPATRSRTNHGQSMNVGGGSTSATFGGLSNGTTLHVHRRRHQRGRSGRRQRRRPTPSSRPVRQAPRRSPAATPDTGRVTRRVERGQPQRQPDHRPTSCRSTAAAGRTSAPARRRRGPGWPTARRTRSRCGPSTTSAPGAGEQRGAGPHARRAGPGRRPRRLVTGPRRDPGDVVGAERQRQADHALRGRPQPRRHRQRDRPLAHVDRARRRHALHRPGPGVQRGRLRRLERRGRARPRPRGRWTSTGARTAPPSASRAAATRRAPGVHAPPPASTPARPTPSRATAPGRAPTRRPSAPPTAAAG